MTWHAYVASFFAGMFLANAVPHLVKGVCGDPFPTPFAKPPGKGLSSPVVNTVWALVNVVIGLALFHAGKVSGGAYPVLAVFFAGAAAISVQHSLHFVNKHAH
jgi:hypothetical protein